MKSEKAKAPYTEENYRFMCEETEKMLIERFGMPANFAKQRAILEVESLKEVFSKMPEFI